MSTAFEKGTMMRRVLLGDAYADRVEAQISDEGMGSYMKIHAAEASFGSIWSREGLDLRSRSILTIGILISLQATHELTLHFRIGLRNGLTLQELEEIVYHTIPYLGFPKAAIALDILKDVAAKLEAEEVA
jgi:4-carboxymuconolactone decarboxylase